MCDYFLPFLRRERQRLKHLIHVFCLCSTRPLIAICDSSVGHKIIWSDHLPLDGVSPRFFRRIGHRYGRAEIPVTCAPGLYGNKNGIPWPNLAFAYVDHSCTSSARRCAKNSAHAKSSSVFTSTDSSLGIGNPSMEIL